ncbi:hypothetical protein Tco_1347763 [Tanacetum coccineum]
MPGAESVGVSDCNKVYKEAGNEAVMSYPLDKKTMYDLKWGKRQDFKALKDIFFEFQNVYLTILFPEKDVLDRPGGSHWHHELSEVYNEVGWSWGSSVFTYMVSDGPFPCVKFTSQSDVVIVTTDDNEDLRMLLLLKKTPSLAPPSTTPAENRDPNEIFTMWSPLATKQRSWKIMFLTDLQIWSYYGNVKELFYFISALSRQTKDVC